MLLFCIRKTKEYDHELGQGHCHLFTPTHFSLWSIWKTALTPHHLINRSKQSGHSPSAMLCLTDLTACELEYQIVLLHMWELQTCLKEKQHERYSVALWSGLCLLQCVSKSLLYCFLPAQTNHQFTVIFGSWHTVAHTAVTYKAIQCPVPHRVSCPQSSTP